MADVQLVKNEDSLRGLFFALGAYGLWGFLPIYMKALAHISPAEVIAHRVLWSVPVAGGLLWALGRTNDLKVALRTPRMLGMAAVTAALISVNWGIYVWAIGSGHALDAALGYYINPLFSVLLGALLLGERLYPTQKLALVLAAAAVAVLTWEAGRLPWVALALTLTWGAYAYLKKSLPIGPNQGFLLEVLLLLPPALGYIGWLVATGQSHFLVGVPMDTVLLFGCGLVTAVPLILYANGAKLLKLSTIGILQYIAPTMIFLSAVFLFGEPFQRAQMIAFPMIWLALVIYTGSMLHRARRA
ncbi:EamA family transporter RarD [Cereibacter changlensis JA139]|uniref:EamA family transporter RarD n=2 Tax=Cereibacter changlensis TaxID=402884 RepID=A0A2T4JVV1_9RHOB|nr:EamA family transporter RarD [Cereibacter changlensis]PTE22040.1 EamA family transporter RarD [Cereibacter changlensis JA139]PZX52176.1 chloramphenicol-sensitive protein RarD [Cereibacter changlensis]